MSGTLWCCIKPRDVRKVLYFGMIPQHYPIEAGKLYGGEYPGHRDPNIAKTRLRHLISLGIRTFVDLTAPADRMAPYEEFLAELVAETALPCSPRSGCRFPFDRRSSAAAVHAGILPPSALVKAAEVRG